MYHIIYNLENMFASLEDCERWLSTLVLRPRIPDHRMFGEDKITPRVCVAETIENCITGIGVTDAFRRCCKFDDNLYCGTGNEDNTEAYPIAVIELADDLRYYKPTNKEVPDVDDTGEYWLMEPARPIRAEIRWMNAYGIEFWWIDDNYEIPSCDAVWFLKDLTCYDHPWLNGKGHTLNGETVCNPSHPYIMDDLEKLMDCEPPHAVVVDGKRILL